jgi:glycosyltransferase involved in cell wall biosynthesis
MPREQVRKSLGFAEDQVVVGFVGRMEEQKAPQRLVAVARRLLPELPKLRFLMIGDGPKRSALEASLGNTGLSDRVTWLGAVDSWQYFAGMDIFALPSLYEGFAYVLLEALSVGLPIVSTPVGGARESIAPGVNGMIVPHDSPEEMAVAIRELATSDDLRRAMGEASRSRAAQFSVQGMIDAIESLYFQVHSAKAAPGQAQRIGDPRIRSA